MKSSDSKMIIALLCFILAQPMTTTAPKLIGMATGIIWLVRYVIEAWDGN